MLSISLLIVFSVFNLALIAADDQEREELYEELFKALYDRKVDQAKEDLRKNFNDALDRGDDVSKLFECADLKAKCSIVKHCCGDFKCSGAFDGVCVNCVKQGQKCYRNNQCCPGYKCLNKPFNGKCGV